MPIKSSGCKLTDIPFPTTQFTYFVPFSEYKETRKYDFEGGHLLVYRIHCKEDSGMFIFDVRWLNLGGEAEICMLFFLIINVFHFGVKSLVEEFSGNI
jgi:hypothetical protein